MNRLLRAEHAVAAESDRARAMSWRTQNRTQADLLLQSAMIHAMLATGLSDQVEIEAERIAAVTAHRPVKKKGDR